MTSPVEHSTPTSEATLFFDYRTEAGALLEPSFVPYDQRVSYSTYATSQNGFPDFRVHPTEPSVAAGGSSPFLSTAHTLIHPTSCSTWENTVESSLSDNIGPSESCAYGVLAPQQVSTDRTVVAGNQSITAHEQERKIWGISPYTKVAPLTDGQATPASSHPEHVASWYHMCWNAVIVDGPRKFIPQTIYQPRSQRDKERYVSLAKLYPPIIFVSQDSPEWGIPISHLLSNQLSCLVDGSEPAFVSCGPSIGIRVQWPGYYPCHKQVSTRDYTSKRRMINKAKLAQVVARCVKQFMDAMSEQAMQVGSDTQWRVSPFDIRVDDIILVSLHHVSRGSWQPQLRLRRIIGTDVSAGPQGHHGS